MSRERKSEKRRRKKTKQEDRSRQWAKQKQRRADFPDVIYLDEDSTPEQLFDQVKSIISTLPTSAEFPRELRRALNDVKNGTKRRRKRVPLQDRLDMKLGSFVYSRLEKSFQTIYRLAHDVEFDVDVRNPRKITVQFRSLEQVCSRIFCSPRQHKLDLDGEQFIAAFRNHTIERIGERTVMNPDQYACRGQAFAIPYRCQYFDGIKLPNGQPAAKIWNWCDPTTFLGKLHAELLGPKATARQHNGWPYFEMNGELCYYLVGYCPIKRREDLPNYAVLESLWIPGMDKTPEFVQYTRQHRLDTVARMNLSKRVAKMTYARLFEHRDFDLIREFHKITPQVRTIKEEVYDY